MKRLFFLLAVLPLLAAGCASPPTVTPAYGIGTLTLAPTLPPTVLPTETSTRTPLPPAPTATPLLIEGTLSIKVNVRSGPGTTYASLGQLNAGEKVKILDRETAGKWYQILFPAASSGFGWVTAQYVQIPSGTEVPFQATPTAAGPAGRVLQRINVRSGPGMSFTTLGMLEPDATVSLTGKNSTASWLQIDYPSGPGGHGWITAQYIQADATGLPVLDNYGTPVAGGTAGPTSIPITPTPTIGPAFNDNDSASSPAIRVVFSASGTRQFTYSSQVSSPVGDTEDWVAFTPYTFTGTEAHLVFSLACSGNAALAVEIWRGGAMLSGWGTLSCGDSDQNISLPAGQVLEMRLAATPGDGLQLVDYVLTVENQP